LATARSRRTIFFPIFLVARKVHDTPDFNSRFGRVQNWKPQGADHSQAAAALPDRALRVRREFGARSNGVVTENSPFVTDTIQSAAQ
jgi:hypothetical protein